MLLQDFVNTAITTVVHSIHTYNKEGIGFITVGEDVFEI